ncbi:unnamed protein product [Acanthoscelides obtectus]|uniref:Gustatory receptor n=1 Tax=Acanthoscelides obtectus TaxID=200917 RepID=A0A9P0PTU5_ACAOB|nr:unnamed protein product [Acanthoscelides obtectus]CAK1657176.1 hypothetical protein AOBTE_LOCUS20179 [Acanthoscelides obtectus]
MQTTAVEKDVNLLKRYCKIGSWVGVVPQEFKSITRKWIALIFRTMIATSIVPIGFYRRVEQRYHHYSGILKIVHCCLSLGRCSLLITSLVLPVRDTKSWYAFFKEIRKLKELLDEAACKDIGNESIKAHAIKFVPCYIGILLLNVWEVYEYEEDGLATTSVKFCMLVSLLIAVLANLMLKVIRNRYKAVNNVLRSSLECIIRDEKLTARTIGQMKQMYINCDNMVGHFNEIFGQMMFWTSMNTGLTLLICLLLAYENEIPDISYVACFSLVAAVYVGFTTVIILSCDATEKQGKMFTNICYKMYAKEQNVYLRDELLSLAIVSEKIGPRFSAAGFYVVNQMFLSTFFSALTSYAIVCIQFSML